MTDRPLSDPRLCSIIEGVESSFVSQGRVVRVILTADAMQRQLGAGGDARSWLETFDANVNLIESAARTVFASTGKTTIVLQKL